MAKTLYCFGDSLTNAGRDHKIKKPNRSEALGHGWVNMLAAEKIPDWQVYNRGVDGYTSQDLAVLLQQIDIKKCDLLSLQIGINDIWWANFSLEQSCECLMSIITCAKSVAKEVLLLEPIAQPKLMKQPLDLEKLKDLQQAWQQIAMQQHIGFVPLQQAIDPFSVLYDGVHATPLGNKLITQEVLKHIA